MRQLTLRFLDIILLQSLPRSFPAYLDSNNQDTVREVLTNKTIQNSRLPQPTAIIFTQKFPSNIPPVCSSCT